ncbi:chitin synthase chs-2-like [Antedon mediterranea]|uniref:chitin synthase chs-2-like n=1 Tax=Antedon mediterranea TaxID=105859 RepID=UPI003AF662FA
MADHDSITNIHHFEEHIQLKEYDASPRNSAFVPPRHGKYGGENHGTANGTNQYNEEDINEQLEEITRQRKQKETVPATEVEFKPINSVLNQTEQLRSSSPSAESGYAGYADSGISVASARKKIYATQSLQSLASGGVAASESGYDPTSDKGSTIGSISNRTGETSSTKRWDRALLRPKSGYEVKKHSCVTSCIFVTKVLSYITLFTLVLIAAVSSKISFIILVGSFETENSTSVETAEHAVDEEETDSEENCDRFSREYYTIIALAVPEILTFIHNTIRAIFGILKAPSLSLFIKVCTIETLHCIGITLFAFRVLPFTSIELAIALTGGVCIIPGVIKTFFSSDEDSTQQNNRASNIIKRMFTFFVTIVLQLGALVTIPYTPDYTGSKWELPLAMFLISLRWWETYVTSNVRFLWWTLPLLDFKNELRRARCKTYIGISVWKCACIVGFSFLFLSVNDKWTIYRCTSDMMEAGPLELKHWLAVQICAAFLCYQFAVTSCQTMIQRFGFALPLALATPVSLAVTLLPCYLKEDHQDEFPWICPSDDSEIYWRLVPMALWVSQLWITNSVWFNRNRRMEATVKLLVQPFYSAGLIDQSLMLNRRPVIEEETVNKPNEQIDVEPDVTYEDDDVNTMIYLCATMWHETKNEMTQILKSICRLDIDQRRLQDYHDLTGKKPKDYYQFEAHIFFDDAFTLDDEDNPEINQFVKTLLECVATAARSVRRKQEYIEVRPPSILDTPYGGRMIWTLPCGNKLIVHLKNKAKIRHRKRWSQVMYMYYLLGWILVGQQEDNEQLIEVKTHNSYVLALDGDIDFKPDAVQRLLDLMKRNRTVGAACGRIHPIGTGPLVWYQKFEYATGHWFQKTAEHVLGCVLCSPGCFSLFRASALMDDNVMRKYATRSEKAEHYVQYDQGEDRWLCTLLLQQGWRVEYCAAADALTYAPEEFEEFYNQRRRWVPSTMANTMDILLDGKRTSKVNQSISMPFIIYQIVLMASSIIGPATVAILIAKSTAFAFNLESEYVSYAIAILPPFFYIIICFTCKTATQLFVAKIMSTIYALQMLAVVISLSGNALEAGLYSPEVLCMIGLISIYLLAAVLHPQEIWNILFGVLHFLAIPSGYVLLVIYSLSNLNIVSWGTREVPKKKTKAEIEQEQTEVIQKAKNGIFGTDLEVGFDGSLTCGCGSLFKCGCCLNPSDDTHYHSLVEALKVTVDNSRTEDHTVEPTTNTDGSTQTDYIPEEKAEKTRMTTDFEIPEPDYDEELPKYMEMDIHDEKPSWMNAPALSWAKIRTIDSEEVEFWQELVSKYLHPIEEDKQMQEAIANRLKELRNKACFAFFMLNAVWIIIIFFLELQSELFAIPLGNIQRTNGDPATIEPFQFAFFILFLIILVIQFIAMISHRVYTLLHILAATDITKKDEEKDPDFVGPPQLELTPSLIDMTNLETGSLSSERTGLYLHELNNYETASEISTPFSENTLTKPKSKWGKMKRRNKRPKLEIISSGGETQGEQSGTSSSPTTTRIKLKYRPSIVDRIDTHIRRRRSTKPKMVRPECEDDERNAWQDRPYF